MAVVSNYYDNFKHNKEKDLNDILVQNKIKFCSCKGQMRYMGGGRYICSVCGKEELDDFGKVKQYLDEHGPSSAYIFSIATGVDKEIINLFLKRCRLEIPDNSPTFIKCEICGEDIKCGRICPLCAREKTNSLKAYLVDEVGDIPNRKGKMHFLNRKNEELRESKRRF